MTPPPHQQVGPLSGESGLTLVELLVVLFILGLLAQVAVVSVDGALESAGRDGSIRSLEALEQAILGRPDSYDRDGQRSFSGFVADIGRLPVLFGDDPADQLAELWLRPPGMPLLSIQSPEGDAEVFLPAGWGGPYLRLGLGRSRLLDSWNRPFEFRQVDGTLAVSGETFATATTLGADALPGGTGFAADLSVAIASDQAIRHQGTVAVRVDSAEGGGEHLVVRIYGPENGIVGTLAEKTSDDTFVSGNIVNFLFEQIPIGARALRVYQVTTLPANPTDRVDDASHVSEVVPLKVLPGAMPVIQIRLGEDS